MRRPVVLYVSFLILLVVTTAHGAGLGPWTLTASTQNVSVHSGIAGVPGYLYEATETGTVEVAPIQGDGSLGAWSFTSPLNSRRAFAITLTSGNHVYVAGGWTSGCCFTPNNKQVEMATINPDGTLSAWTFTSPMINSRANHAGAAGAGRLYMLANYAGSTSVESAGVQPGGSLSAWRPEASTEENLERPAAAVVGTYLYVIDGSGGSNHVERAPIGMDGVLGAWEYASSTQDARYELGAAAIGNLLFALGGYGTSNFASVEVADATGGSLGPWSYTSTMTMPRSNCDATSVGSTLYADGVGDTSVEFANLPTTSTTSSMTTSSTTTTTVPADTDGDGVPDSAEACVCVGTPPGVPVTALGCSVEQACPCAAPLGRAGWATHSEYRRCVKYAVMELEKRGAMTRPQAVGVLAAAARATCGR
jgi:hypothetical protein